MTGSILWYLHDQGAGHLARARAVLPKVRSPVVVAAGPGIAAEAAWQLDHPVVALPGDIPRVDVPTVGPWHHAPASTEVRARSLALAEVVVRHHCTTAVVDVSMEVTVLARLLGLRVVSVRQSGVRTDPPHRAGFDSADVVWVPQHPDLEPVDDVTDRRSTYTGAFSRFDVGAQPDRAPSTGRRTVVLLAGSGGTSLDTAAWRRARVPDGWHVVIAGPAECWDDGAVRCIGRVDPILPTLLAADVVVTSAGWAATADVVSAGARLVLVPERRPFDEQEVRATALAGAGLAVRVEHWPRPDALAALLDDAMALAPRRWHRFYDRCGADRAATMIDGLHES